VLQKAYRRRAGKTKEGTFMNSFLSYRGGKSLLTRRILPLIPEHTCYCEVFCGAAWLLFAKPESDVEIINDINSDLVTL
jgi:DNA adenine methylase